MRKQFAMLVLLVAAIPSCFAQTTPTIVATVKLTDQTTAIPKTVLFTPTTEGTFRLSVYMVTTVPATNGSAAEWVTSLNWTDDASYWFYSDASTVAAGRRTNSIFCCKPGSNPLTFSAKGGMPITYAVSSRSGNPSGSTYEVFITLEQLM